MCRLMIAMLGVLLLSAWPSLAPAQAPRNDGSDLESLLKSFPSAKADPKDDALRKLLRERYNAAVNEVGVRFFRVAGGQATSDDAISAARRIVESGLEVFDKPADQLSLLEKDVALMKWLEKATKERVDAGVKSFSPADLNRATYARADAEIRLLRFKEKMKGDKK